MPVANLPNGNPALGAKFNYKLRWIERLTASAETLFDLKAPALLIGDFNIIPTEMDVYKPEKWIKDALFRIEIRKAFKRIISIGWTDAIRTLYPNDRIYTFWDYFRNAYQRDAVIRIDHFLLSPQISKKLISDGVDSHVRGWEKTSDPAPVWIEIKIPEKNKCYYLLLFLISSTSLLTSSSSSFTVSISFNCCFLSVLPILH